MWLTRVAAQSVQNSCCVLPTLDETLAGPPPEGGYDAFKAARGNIAARTVVLSVPKAGTYLMAKVLENLGLVDLEVHLWESGLSDYRLRSLEAKITQARALTRDIPIEVSARMVLPGQFAVGHILCTPEARVHLASFLRIVCLRDLRKALVSFMRFERRRLAADPLRNPDSRAWVDLPDGPAAMQGFLAAYGAWIMETARGIVGWLDDPAAVVCRFDDLVGENGAACQSRSAEAVARALGLKASAGSKALRAALEAPTLTRSEQRASLDGVWDASVEAAFRAIGGPEANEMLGYPGAASLCAA